LTVKIPWKKLGTEPTVITIDRVYLIAGPVPPSQYNSEIDEKKELNTKIKKITI